MKIGAPAAGMSMREFRRHGDRDLVAELQMKSSMAMVVVFLALLVGVARPALLRPTPVASTPRAALSMMASPVRTDAPLSGSAKELPSTKTTGSYQLTGDKLYTKKEIPPALGGIRLGFRKLAVVTGASSGLGLWTAKALADKGDYFVICAVRDPKKMDAKAKEVGISSNDYCAMKLELGSFQSVKDFVFNLKAFKSERPLTHLVCNAAVYRPADPEPAWTDDGYEMSVGVNHLGHFLLLQLLLPDLERAKGARCVVVGSITGNSNTIGGGFVYPRAEIGELKGLKKGGGRSSEMVDGGKFDGAKAYKDAKALNMMTVTGAIRRAIRNAGAILRNHSEPPPASSCAGDRAPPALPRQDGDRLLVDVPRLHRRDGPLPREAPVVPRRLPAFHEVRHRRLRLGAGGGRAAGAGDLGREVLQVG